MSDRFQRGDEVAARYVIERHLGAGGFADVYLALDQRSNEQVALKVISAQMSQDRVIARRVQREARIARELRHRGLVGLNDSGTLPDGRLFLAFEYVPGDDLAELLRGGPMPSDDVRRLLTQLLSALAAAHRAGIIHRDIKPENIRVFRASDGELTTKLLDFGIARPTVDGSPALTATGELIGTPRYMSPEQLTNRPLGPPADVYSLGLVALELLLGREALHGNRWGDQIDRLRSGHVFAVEGTDAALLNVIGKMTARRPEDRFGSAQAALSALEGRTPPKLAAERSARPKIVGGVVAVVVIGLCLWIADQRDSVEEPSPRTRTLRAPPVRSPVERASPRRDVSVVEPCTTPPRGELIALTPCRYDPKVRYPLVVIFRDYEGSISLEMDPVLLQPGGLEWQLLRSGGFLDVADEHNVIFVAVEGNPVRHWAGADTDELSRLRDVVRKARKAFSVDPARIFLLGLGHGGGPVYKAACESGVAGIATFAHHISHGVRCTTPNKPMMLLFPTANPHHPRDGGEACEGDNAPRPLSQLNANWIERNNCEGGSKPHPTRQPGLSCERWACAAGSAFVSCEVEGGRPWPGLASVDSGACSSEAPDADLAQVTWDFFDSLAPVPPERQYDTVTKP